MPLFERPHHRRIGSVLEALDGPLLAANNCLFGGGTAIALRYGEYRESVDIDLLVSDAEGYRTLRQLLVGPAGLGAVVGLGPAVRQARDVRCDQYGLRTVLVVDGIEIKFEIIREARIALEAPGPEDRVCGVATLTPLDMATSKLLANSDRWADDGTFSRDLIDLAMMQPGRVLLGRAIAKASAAYGTSIRTDLARAIAQLAAREHRLERCMEALKIEVPRAVIWDRIKALTPR